MPRFQPVQFDSCERDGWEWKGIIGSSGEDCGAGKNPFLIVKLLDSPCLLQPSFPITRCIHCWRSSLSMQIHTCSVGMGSPVDVADIRASFTHQSAFFQDKTPRQGTGQLSSQEMVAYLAIFKCFARSSSSFEKTKSLAVSCSHAQTLPSRTTSFRWARCAIQGPQST